MSMKEPCDACGKPSEATCSRCKAANYCGQECQRSNWKAHRAACKAAAAAQAAAAAREAEPEVAPTQSSASGAPPAACPAEAAKEQQGSRSMAEALPHAPTTLQQPSRQGGRSGTPGDPAGIDVTLTGSRSIENAQKVVDVLKERGVCVISAGAENAFRHALFLESKLLWDGSSFVEAKKGKPAMPGSPVIKFDTRDDKVLWMTKSWMSEHEREIKALKVLDDQLTDFGWGLAKLMEEQLGLTIASRTPGMLSCYPGHQVDGPRYDFHLDNPYQSSMGTPDDKRRLTLVYYISEAPWDVRKDGGALQVALSNPRRAPMTTEEALGSNMLTISPDADTLVAFFSHTMYHAVLPVMSKRPRFALSTWMNTA